MTSTKGYASDTLTPKRTATAYAAYADATPLLSAAARYVIASGDAATTEALLILPALITDDTATDAEDLAGDYGRRALAIGRREHAASLRTGGTEIPAGDWLDVSGLYAEASVPMRPGAVAAWRDADTLDAVTTTTLDYVARAILDALRTPAAWNVESGTVNASGVARALVADGTAASVATARRIVAARLADVLADARDAAPRVLTAAHVVSNGHAGSIATDRDARESGTASACIVTRPNGERWALFATVAHRVNDDTARMVLARTDTLPAYVTPTRGADLAGMRDGTADAPATLADHVPTAHLTSTAPRPAGIPAGGRYGQSSVAGTGAPQSKRTPSPRKRGASGGIGGPMLTGASAMGNGAPGVVDGTRRADAACNGHADRTHAGAYCPRHRVAYCTGERA